MRTYRITIEEALDGDSQVFTKRAVIVCDSVYRLPLDIMEWIKAEVDTKAEMDSACRACVQGDHDECIDGTRISSVPLTCLCALDRHGEMEQQPVIEPSFTCERCGSVFAATDYHAYAAHIAEPHSSDGE